MIKPVSEEIVHKAIKNPEMVYDNPEDVLADSRINPRQKSQILESWHEDVVGLLRAEEENMSSTDDGRAGASVLLRKISKTKEKLQTKFC